MLWPIIPIEMMQIGGGLMTEGKSFDYGFRNLILTIVSCVGWILMIGIHLFFIRKNSKSDKDICKKVEDKEIMDKDLKKIY